MANFNRSNRTDYLPKGISSNMAKLPPQNIEAEQSLLGALLIDKDAIVAIAQDLRPDHFYKTEQHGHIYSAIIELFEKREPIDLITVTEKINRFSFFKKLKNGTINKIGRAHV